jgi:hypothetical protein
MPCLCGQNKGHVILGFIGKTSSQRVDHTGTGQGPLYDRKPGQIIGRHESRNPPGGMHALQAGTEPFCRNDGISRIRIDGGTPGTAGWLGQIPVAHRLVFRKTAGSQNHCPPGTDVHLLPIALHNGTANPVTVMDQAHQTRSQPQRHAPVQHGSPQLRYSGTATGHTTINRSAKAPWKITEVFS